MTPVDKPAPVSAQHQNWLMCHDCGALQASTVLHKDVEMLCGRCGNRLHVGRGEWLSRATALTLTALLLFIGSHAMTFLTLKVAGATQSVTIMSGVGALIEHGYWLLAALVFTTIFLYPLLEILALLYVLIPYHLDRPAPGQMHVLRYLKKAQPWNMMDVFLLGVLVTTVKLNDEAVVVLGSGIYVFFLLVGLLHLTYRVIDKNNVWAWLYPNNCFTTNRDETLCSCGICEALVGVSIVREHKRCPRCASPLHERTPNSLQKVAALVLAATVLYIPSNLLPVMVYDELGVAYVNTILSGVVELMEAGLWFIAAIVFIASIVVPVAKLLILYYLVWSVQKQLPYGARHRTRLFRIVEIIGRWSMVDVFVVTLLTAAVQFGFLGTVAPGPALLPFAAVIVLTMLAAEAFDPRLIWDNTRSGQASEAPRPTLAGLDQQKQ